MSESDWFALNRASWNARPRCISLALLRAESVQDGRSSLRSIELEQEGDAWGRSLLHLQCHFGQDTLSWARLGARVTGPDPSDVAIAAARPLAAELGIPLGSVVTALLGQGLVLERLNELDWSPYDIFPDVEEVSPERFRMRRFGRKLPRVYGLVARGEPRRQPPVRTATRPGERRCGAPAA